MDSSKLIVPSSDVFRVIDFRENNSNFILIIWNFLIILLGFSTWSIIFSLLGVIIVITAVSNICALLCSNRCVKIFAGILSLLVSFPLTFWYGLVIIASINYGNWIDPVFWLVIVPSWLLLLGIPITTIYLFCKNTEKKKENSVIDGNGISEILVIS